MKNNFIRNLAVVCAVGGLLCACAKDRSESANAIQKRILEAYVQEYYPNAEQMASGIYVLSRTEGTGQYPNLYDAVYIDYSTRNLSGTYLSTTSAEVAKQLGTYSASTYYGPDLKEIGYGTTYPGLEELLSSMTEGGRVTAIVPPWLTNSSYGSVTQQSQTENIIYDIELRHVIKNILDFQRDTLKSFSKLYYGGLDSTASGFYFKTLFDAGDDTVEANKHAQVRYVGKLLNGWVFDTNIADTAKKYGIYDADNSYSAMDITYKETDSEMKESNSVVAGFAKALKMMSYGDKAVTFFNSNYGYGSEAQDKIPAFQPLFFYLEVEPNGDSEE